MDVPSTAFSPPESSSFVINISSGHSAVDTRNSIDLNTIAQVIDEKSIVEKGLRKQGEVGGSPSPQRKRNTQSARSAAPSASKIPSTTESGPTKKAESVTILHASQKRRYGKSSTTKEKRFEREVSTGLSRGKLETPVGGTSNAKINETPLITSRTASAKQSASRMQSFASK